MRKLIAAMNMTIDGFCDHTAGIADEELHQHYADLLKNSGVILYGRITYQLMEYWRTVVKNPTGEKATDEFAIIMDKTPKIVFSHTLKSVDWDSATLADKGLKETVLDLKQQSGKNILVGSPSLIVALHTMGLIDEYQLCVHPVILGNGLPLFRNIADKSLLRLLKTKPFTSGAITLYYTRSDQNAIKQPT